MIRFVKCLVEAAKQCCHCKVDGPMAKIYGRINKDRFFVFVTHEVHVFGPAPLQQIIEMQFAAAHTHMCYPLHFHTLTQDEVLVDNDKIKISCFRTDHRIECYGFVFDEKMSKRKLLIDRIRQLRIPVTFYSSLQNGLDYITSRGEVIKNDTVTAAPEKGKRYAFCADTRYDESIIPHIAGADMIYHEATYHDNMRDKAFERFHSTTKQAATIAKKAGIKKLLIGHFSSKYNSLETFLKEAKEVFPNSDLAIEGITYEIH